jgi:CBS-domain-containing membrane protein
MKVAEIMSREVGCVTADAHANDAACVMWECDCGIVPVVESNETKRLVGVITDRDVCMAAYTQGKTLGEISVRTAMSTELLTCSADDPLSIAEDRMRSAQIRRLPVVDAAQHLVGVISLADIAREAKRPSRTQRPDIQPREVADTLAGITEPRQNMSPNMSPAQPASL